jgi:hypothetical protein
MRDVGKVSTCPPDNRSEDEAEGDATPQRRIRGNATWNRLFRRFSLNRSVGCHNLNLAGKLISGKSKAQTTLFQAACRIAYETLHGLKFLATVALVPLMVLLMPLVVSMVVALRVAFQKLVYP